MLIEFVINWTHDIYSINKTVYDHYIFLIFSIYLKLFLPLTSISILLMQLYTILRPHSRLVVLLEVFFVFHNYECEMGNFILFKKGKRVLTSSEEGRATNKKNKNADSYTPGNLSSSDNEERIQTPQTKLNKSPIIPPKTLFSSTTSDWPTPNKSGNSNLSVLNAHSSSKEGVCCRQKASCVFESKKRSYIRSNWTRALRDNKYVILLFVFFYEYEVIYFIVIICKV